MQVLASKVGKFGQKIRLVSVGDLFSVKVSAHKWSDPKVCGGQEFSEPRRVAYSSHSVEAATSIFSAMN